jgi:hypothetical protein
MKKVYWLLLAMTFSLNGLNANSLSSLADEDSIQSKRERKSTITVTTRAHSRGFFSYTGRIISDYPATDFYFNYTTRDHWGFSLFKVVDLGDAKSYNNFLLLMMNRKIILNRKLNVNIYGGFILEQIHHFADRGSDVAANVITTYRVSKHLSIEHTGMLGNLVLARSNSDWVNRLRLIYTNNHLELTGWAWHNNRILDRSAYSSLGLSAFYNKVPVSKRVNLGAGVTGLWMISTSDATACPKKNGLLVSVSATWH